MSNFLDKPVIEVAKNIKAKQLVSPDETDEGSFSAHVMQINPDGFFDPHTHPGEHLLIVLSGSGYLDLWGGDKKKRKMLKTGDVVVVPANKKHASGAYQNGMRLVVVDVPGTCLEDEKRIQYTKDD